MTCRPTTGPRAAFTLIEIMVVCAIIGIVMTIAIPSIYRQLHPESMQKAVTDIKDACDTARGHAVLNATTMKLVIRPFDKQFQVTQGGSPKPRLESRSVSGEEWRMEERTYGSPISRPSGNLPTFKLSDRIMIEGIRLHLKDFTEDEVVEVNFYPNGTCDEFSLLLVSGEGERRQISLEVATALIDIESDPRKFR
jgi:prepilin-type N-terminal cleavage/methylation domain-containing protein